MCTSQDIFKRKQKIEIKKKHFFYLPFYFTWPKYNEKWVVHLFYFPVGPYVILAILGVMEWDPRISVRNFNLVLLFFSLKLVVKRMKVYFLIYKFRIKKKTFCQSFLFKKNCHFSLFFTSTTTCNKNWTTMSQVQ